MKKILTVLLLMVLSLNLCAPALAEPAFETTRASLALLDELGIPYTNRGIDEDGDEYVLLINPDEELEYNVHMFFEKDQEHTSIFVWYLIEYDPADELIVMQICNMLNAKYRFTCFYADTSDNTVTCSMNLIYRDDQVGQVNAQALVYLMRIIDEALPVLQEYAK